MTQSLWKALFEPTTIALVGASGEPGKNTARPQLFLRKHGWQGQIRPVNRNRAQLFDEPAYPDIESIPDSIDHAFVMVPGPQLAEVIEACGRKKVPVVTVYSDGFAESGPEGAIAQQALANRARALGIRLLGPNCIGLINVVARMPLTVNAALAGELLPPGRIAVVSQSGSMLGTLLSRGQARGICFSRLISVGNEADLSVGEITHMLVGDPHTQVILLFLETLRDAPRLAQAARDAHAAGKAIVVYKLGRSRLGADLAVSHTGAIAGEDAAFDAFFRAHGIVRVNMIETLLEIAPLLEHYTPPASRIKHPRVAVVSTTGGGAAMVVDRLGLSGIEAATPDARFVREMAEKGIPIRPAPIIDLTLAATPQKYASVLRGLLSADFCDAVLAVVGSSAQFQPSLAVEPIVSVARELRSDKPLACFLAPAADASLALLAEQGIAAFRTPEACADALAACLSWEAPTGSFGLGHEQSQALSRVRAVLETLTRGVVDEESSLTLMDALGIPTVPRIRLHSPPWINTLPWPVAAKLISADLPHKTEAGAVTLNVNDQPALDEAVARMLNRVRQSAADKPMSAVRIDGVLVQTMVRGDAEVLLGYRHDALLGPLITVGVGGQLAEVYRDACTRLAPVTDALALEMIYEVRGLSPIRGWRGLPSANLNALAQAISALSKLALVAGQPVAEAEINPLIVSRQGVLAVDALLVLKSPELQAV
jgi:acyl-CoA synthetase (NDP forming)